MSKMINNLNYEGEKNVNVADDGGRKFTNFVSSGIALPNA